MTRFVVFATLFFLLGLSQDQSVERTLAKFLVRPKRMPPPVLGRTDGCDTEMELPRFDSGRRALITCLEYIAARRLTFAARIEKTMSILNCQRTS